MCLSEMCLKSPVPYDNPRSNLIGSKLVRAGNLRAMKEVVLVFILKSPSLSDHHLFKV